MLEAIGTAPFQMAMNPPENQDKTPKVIEQSTRKPVTFKVEPINYINHGKPIQTKPLGTLVNFEV